MLQHRIASLHRRILALEEVAPSAEGHFFDNPQLKSVREFGNSEAISNKPDVATKAVKESDAPDRSVTEAKKESLGAPPPPEEVVEQAGGKEFSTLTQLLVETEEPVKGVPKGYEDAPKAEPIPSHSEEVKKQAVKQAMRKLGYR